MSRFKQYAVN